MPRKRSRFLTNTGVTLVELTIAAAIFSIAILPLFVLLNRTMKEVMFYNRTTVATKLGQDLMEEILNMPKWDENSVPGKAIVPVTNATAPPLGIEGVIFDDIDDYNNVSDTQVAGSNINYYRSVIVEYVDALNAGGVPAAASGVRTDFKRIIVRVTWDRLDANFAGRNPVEIITIVANINNY